MANLVGGVATFEGDPEGSVWVTVPSIVAGCGDGDEEVPPFLARVVGDACPGIYATKLDVLQMSQDAYAEITGEFESISPCTWLRYFAPLAFKSDFNISSPGASLRGTSYQVSATWLQNTRIRTFPILEDDCMESIDRVDSFLVFGSKPVEVSTHPALPYCFYPGGVGTVLISGGAASAESFQANFIKPGSLRVVGFNDDGTPVSPSNILNGEVSMPIPPIPDGYPEPPSAPPLQGQINSDEVSDDVAYDIVRRGQGFQTWWDIGNRAFNQDDGERGYMQFYTQVLGDLNTDVLPDVVTIASEEILTQTTQIVLGKILDRVVDAGKVVIKSGGANKILTILGPAGKIIQTIEIASELIQEVQMLLQQLFVPQCVGSNRPNIVGTFQMVPIPFPVQTLDGVSQLAAFQAICDMLFMLGKCCPPCVTDIWHQGPDLLDGQKWFPEFTFSEVLFQIIEVKYRENASMGGQDKLGWFKWIEQQDGNPELHDINVPIWVNGDLAVFRPQNNFTKGLLWQPQNGVSVRLYYKFAPQEWEMNRFLAPQIP